jgi:CSLREA domain-containing protein
MTCKTEQVRTKRRASTGGASSGLRLELVLLVLPLWLAGVAMHGQMRQPAAARPVGTTIVVDTPADDNTANGNCTLREAIIAANTDAAVDNCPAGKGADTVLLPPDTYILTLAGADEDAAATGDLDLTDDVMLLRQSAGETVVDGNGLDRVFQVGTGVQVTLDGLIIQGGDSGPAAGGGIFSSGVLTLTHSTIAENSSLYWAGGAQNAVGGHMAILDSTIRDNQVVELPPAGCMGGGIHNLGILIVERSVLAGNSAYCAGAIENQGVLTATNVTVSGNWADTSGGIDSWGPASLINVTITDNFSNWEGSGLSGSATVWNSIVSDNPGGNCSGPITSGGHNLDSGDTCGFDAPGDLVNTPPLLSALQDNGGATHTHALLTGSPAIDAGAADACPAIDQRGVPRPADGDGDGLAVCDIGAYEVEEQTPPGFPIFVDTTDDELLDDGDCSLREAIQAANIHAAVDACPVGGVPAAIHLPTGVYTLTLGALDVQTSLTIHGAGALHTRIVGGAYDRLLHISPTLTVEINGVTMTHGRAPSGIYPQNGEDGGGIYNMGTLILNWCAVEDSTAGDGSPAGQFDTGTSGGHGGGIYNTGTLILNYSTISGNAAGDALSGPYGGRGNGGDGGGVYNAGTLHLNNATVSGNRAGDGAAELFVSGDGGSGGGIWNTGTVFLDNVTLAENVSGAAGNLSGRHGKGGGIYNAYAEVHLRNTLLARNLSVDGVSDCEGTALVSHGYNLVEDAVLCAVGGDLAGVITGVDARLGSLANHGGPTLTHALDSSSPALDSGACTDMDFKLVLIDQRGVSRPQGAGCDLGAFEWEARVHLPIVMRGSAGP